MAKQLASLEIVNGSYLHRSSESEPDVVPGGGWLWRDR